MSGPYKKCFECNAPGEMCTDCPLTYCPKCGKEECDGGDCKETKDDSAGV